MERRISISTPAVGSSSISSFGSCTIARAIIRRRFIPPESVRVSMLRSSQRRTALRHFSALRRACRGVSPKYPAWCIIVGNGLSNMLRFTSCGVTPIHFFTAAGCVSRSWPYTWTLPAVLLTSVVMMPMAVVLPAPFGPSSA